MTPRERRDMPWVFGIVAVILIAISLYSYFGR
jgi:hypothetical protein